ncbi:cytochrome P450 [Streptoalloteichus hindustanus]|uniref:Fatty-acid peroxygenase n=1 Tax=Streptoalloteichus hindustanus TaxID=2017 RepID=A0A1M5FRP5_STRHI|nr:cytochrome P450 [Streptoalloteichus hindustanus]SHF94220.1 fatty-acid peroxygenase [Streptoalloteichus hindustanus]
MRLPRGVLDNTLSVLREGYGWLPGLRRRHGTDMVHTRVLGQRAVGLCGPDAARFFYDEEHVRRHTALPELVRGTLFGKGAVHTLDGEAHRRRKHLFLDLVTPENVAALAKQVGEAWDHAVAGWEPGQPVVVLDEASRVITRGVCRWAGVPVDDQDVPEVARDLVAMVDGFATLGPRHWRARRARGRRERWLASLVDRVRRGEVEAPAGSALDAVARHRDADGDVTASELAPKLAAVELLNVIRPTVAVCWFVAFAAHALHRWPEHRQRLRDGDAEFTESFVHELRRFYPFAPFVGGRAVSDLTWRGDRIPRGALVLLDLYGQNHDGRLWEEPYAFRPDRFLGRKIGAFELVPQGGGDPRTGHRCPGEPFTVAVLSALVPRLAALDHEVPGQDLGISLSRVPARPASGFVLVPRRR